MLPVHRGDQLAAIEFVLMEHWDFEIGAENVLRVQCQGAVLHWQDGASKDMIDFDFDACAVSLDKEFHFAYLRTSNPFHTRIQAC